MEINLIEATHLGKNVNFPQKYDSSVLVAVPRKLNREIYNIDEENLPFVGYDTWHAYEVSFLTESGLPIVGILKIVYSSNSTFLVESKSLKLYLNSLNMEKFGKNREEGIKVFTQLITKDLSELLKTEMKISFFTHNQKLNETDFTSFEIIEDSSEIENLEFTNFKEDTSLLKTTTGGELKIGSHLLRSNCKITHQPDWGSVYVHIQGDKLPTKESFLKYIVSIRNENHFHEEICEMIYVRLLEICEPEILTVSCIYTRRGGIDICPTRSNEKSQLPQHLTNINTLTFSNFRQ